ncbi:hypothetical protein [Salinicola socius]|uniref:Uncharacterized protein n=1 Tax=Salinicola socius TaxID=404433 RepID=A0A1Q8SU12_9GAMM|nr:hypothetical protein [Salinicola socius]OLO04914.1 hypothetical protein BTW07_06735 [Salinicola socius]
MNSKALGILSLTTTLACGFSGVATAQSDAEAEAYQNISKPLSPGDGVTADDASGEEFSGSSQASAESLGNVKNETDEPTEVENSESLDQLSADGHSDAAADAIENQ